MPVVNCIAANTENIVKASAAVKLFPESLQSKEKYANEYTV